MTNWWMFILQMVTYDVFLITHFGYSLWYDEEEVGAIGVRAAGVKGINLKEEDYVIGAKVISKR